jgi:hypothetical protein
MLSIGLKLKGYAIEATDGTLGTVADALFDDKTWLIRWIVVDTGPWLIGRQVLIHPSAITHADDDRRTLSVNLRKAQVKASPDIATDEPVSRRASESLYGYYGWNPMWGGVGYLGPMPGGGTATLKAVDHGADMEAADPDLRSIAAVAGYYIQAADGAIGHVENFLIDEVNWAIHYLVVDTRNWWPGQHVLISPYAVRTIDWLSRDVRVDLSRETIRQSPSWKPEDIVSGPYLAELHDYYGWPRHGQTRAARRELPLTVDAEG